MNKYYNNNKEKCKAKMREYYQKNKAQLKKNSLEYYKKNGKIISEKNKEKYIWDRFERVIKQREYYQQNKKEILKKMSDFSKQNRDIMNKKRIRYEQKYPEKVKARNIAKYRIQIPKQQLCEICKINKATERHHEDYNKPLKIKFVCHQCHGKLERLQIC